MKNYILIVDDDEDDRLMLKESFAMAGNTLDLVCAGDGVEALNFLNNADTTPRFIMLDLNMPLKNGMQLLAEIKADNNLKTIPVIIFSTSGDQATIDKCYQHGANTFVVKPTSFTTLQVFAQTILHYWVKMAAFA